MLDGLGYWKLSARWVLCLLAENHKSNHVTVFERLLVQYWAEGMIFWVILSPVMRHDAHYTSESKHASMEWWQPRDAPPSGGNKRPPQT